MHENNKWNYMVGKVDTAIVKALHNPEWEEKCAHLDACGGITPMPVVLHPLYSRMSYHPQVCPWALYFLVSTLYPAKDVEAMFLQNPSVMFNLNGRVLDKLSMDLYPNKKRVRLLRWFGNSGHKKKDMMMLSMEVSVHESDRVEDKSHSCIVSQMLFCGVLWEGLG